MNIQNLMLTLFLCCCTSIAFAQHQSTFTKSKISIADVESINKELPPHLQIDNTGKIIQSSSRNLISLWDSTNYYGWDINNLNWEMTGKEKAVLYSSEGLLLKTESFSIDQNTGQTNLYGSYHYYYGPNNLRNSLVNLSWNGTSWDSLSISNYQFNNSGYLTLYESYRYNNGQRVPNIKRIYTYDNNNNILVDESFNNQQNTNLWNPSRYYESTYDNNGNRVELEGYFNWDNTNNTWEFAEKSVSFYDANNYLTGREIFDFNNGNWILNKRAIMTTNNDGFITQAVQQDWISATQSWINTDKSIFTYNNDNILLEQLNQTWDSTQWINKNRQQYTINSLGQKEIVLRERWRNGVLEMFGKIEYDYDADENITRRNSYFYNIDSTVLMQSTAYEQFYSLKSVNTTNIVKNNLKVYPNPTKEIVYLDLPTELNNTVISIWDLQGRLVHQENYNQNSVNIGDLTKGIYILKVTNEITSYTTKIIKN